MIRRRYSLLILLKGLRQRRLPATGTAILIILFCFILPSCKNNYNEIKLVVSRANVNIEKGKDVVINYSDHGFTRIKAIAPTATRFNKDKPYFEFSDGIKILFYNSGHEVESTLTARYATAYENSHSMTARDSVVVVNNKGERLNTDELIWDEDRKIIYSNSFVKITTADEIIYGNGMTANENFTDYVIKHITGKIKVKSSEL
jgi:LPS export ABC transporter protein LptC